MKFKDKEIHPYESFYWDTTEAFFRGELGGGIARCVKTDDSLAVLVPYETERDIRTIEEQRQERESCQTQSE
jgi:hypothetical protein